jgi:pimeloyl-ACP methyl ester carboxylesterase
VSLFPKTRDDYDRWVDKNRRLGESCIAKTRDIINHLDTISVAKDHEAVRTAFGEDEMFNWFGLSYETHSGGQYAQLFPDKVGAMVLDGVVQHSQAESLNILAEGTAYEAALRSSSNWASTDENSILQGQAVEKLWYDILRNATETPIRADACSSPAYNCRLDVTGDEIRLNIQGLLLSPYASAMISLASAISSLAQDFSLWVSTPVAQKPTDANYTIPVIFLESTRYAGVAVGCQDWSAQLSSFEDFQAKMRIGQTFTPLTQGASQSWTVQASCVGWPAPITNSPTKLDVDTGTDNPILMVSAIRDPSTSYAWAVGMQEEIK